MKATLTASLPQPHAVWPSSPPPCYCVVKAGPAAPLFISRPDAPPHPSTHPHPLTRPPPSFLFLFFLPLALPFFPSFRLPRIFPSIDPLRNLEVYLTPTRHPLRFFFFFSPRRASLPLNSAEKLFSPPPPPPSRRRRRPLSHHSGVMNETQQKQLCHFFAPS